MLFANEIINLQNLMTNLFDFQCSVRHTLLLSLQRRHDDVISVNI